MGSLELLVHMNNLKRLKEQCAMTTNSYDQNISTFSETTVENNLGKYLRQAEGLLQTGNIDVEQHSVELCLMVIQCLEVVVLPWMIFGSIYEPHHEITYFLAYANNQDAQFDQRLCCSLPT